MAPMKSVAARHAPRPIPVFPCGATICDDPGSHAGAGNRICAEVMNSNPTARRLTTILATPILLAALAIGIPAVADAEQREVTSQAYKDCIDRVMGNDGARYELAIEACCIGAGNDSEALYDDNGDAFTCVETVTDEGNASPPPSKAPSPVSEVVQPGLAPPPTPTTTTFAPVPAPAPGLAPR
jgi:hypothetical protein